MPVKDSNDPKVVSVPVTLSRRDETREDYALRRVPDHYRKSPFSIAMVLSGAVWSVFSFALGGQLALAYGIPTTLIALGIGYVVGAALCVMITRLTAANGLDIDLLSRGLGYGFMGSSMSSFVYGLTFLMYCGFEGAFMASALHAQWPVVPLWLLNVIIAAILVPINWYGFKLNDLLQRITWPLFILGVIMVSYFTFTTNEPTRPLFEGAVTLTALLAAVAACIPVLTVQALLVGDWSRFARRSDVRKVEIIASTVALGGVFLVEAPLGAFLAVYAGNANPGVYAVTGLGTWGMLWVLLTQLRIQNMNYYSASLAFANFAARVFRWTPGRQFWVMVVAVLTAIAAVSNILDNLLNVLTFFGCVLLAWAGTLIADMFVVKRQQRLSLDAIEYRRGYLTRWGWSSMTGLFIGSVVGGWLTLAAVPSEVYGPFVGQVMAFLLAGATHIIISGVTRRRWKLIARTPAVSWETSPEAPIENGEKVDACAVCGSTYIRTDMLPCPVVDTNVICSVCCGSHTSCKDVCKSIPVFLGQPDRGPHV